MTNRKPQKDVFVMINYRTNEKYLCSWNENVKEYYGQKVHYIGVTNGLGGYNYMESKGFKQRALQISEKYYYTKPLNKELYDKIQTYLSEKQFKASVLTLSREELNKKGFFKPDKNMFDTIIKYKQRQINKMKNMYEKYGVIHNFDLP